MFDVLNSLRFRLHRPNHVARHIKSAFAPVISGCKYLDRHQYQTTCGASTSDIKKVEQFAHESELAVADIHPGRRTVKLSGTVGAFNKAFDVDLRDFVYLSGRYRGRTGPVQVPSNLDKVIIGVLGLDNRPVSKPHMRIRKRNIGPQPAAPRATGFTPIQVGTAYNFPAGFDGTGQCIAIIELGGGYKTADLDTYFKSLGLQTPSVKAVSVDQATNKPSGPNSADGEVMVDVEVAGATAPKAEIVVYFAPNTDQGFLDAVNAAIHDATNKPSIVSISWGGPESTWTVQSLNAFNSAFQDAATIGVTVCAAAGDDGSTDGVADGQLHVDSPPRALMCWDAAGPI